MNPLRADSTAYGRRTTFITELEAQVAAAEARAKEAEDEALHLSPEADLRARLARSAAKKKFGPSG